MIVNAERKLNSLSYVLTTFRRPQDFKIRFLYRLVRFKCQKKMQRLIISILICSGCFISSTAQVFELGVPAGWIVETFPIPIEFAPQIPYSGEEHLRFCPGWNDPNSEQLWTYCFLWWIDSESKITSDTLSKHLNSYYSGLVGRNIVKRKIDAASVVPTMASFKEVATNKGDSKTFQGNVKMLDYLSVRPMTLNVEVHVIPCTEAGHLALFFLVSPQPRGHVLWKQLNSIYEGFRCRK
jgi:hypothetical protein